MNSSPRSTGPVTTRLLWERQDAGTVQPSYTATVPKHGVVLLKLTGSDPILGTGLDGDAADDAAFARRGRSLYERHLSESAARSTWRACSGGSLLVIARTLSVIEANAFFDG
ncbi:hypothetical protein [Sphaerisporangium perillae]|uniref:hypothetical protein n=1 Tax=Sphaerisporangium perillae TaxID=2935860 RepID=UPI00200FE10A|nr:hypothetical protein [Sphaerisporangium perillae]